MAAIGLVTTIGQYVAGHYAGASSPKANAWHRASDTASDVLVAIIEGVALGTPRLEKNIRQWGAYFQIILLIASTSAIGYEIFHKITHTIPVEALTLLLAGIIGLVGDGLRLTLLNLNRGEWNINRIIQDKDTRIDLFNALMVTCVGGIVYLFGLEWFDILASIVIFFFAIKMTWDACIHTKRDAHHSHDHGHHHHH